MSKFEELLLQYYCSAYDLELEKINKDYYLNKALKLCHLKRREN